MLKDSSAKYYQNNIVRLQKKTRERYQSRSKEEKEKSHNLIANDTKIYKILLSLEINIVK